MSMKYRLALDLGSTSLGWAVLRLNERHDPTAIIKAGVRIFSDGRNPKDGASLAVTRRQARAMRRRRDRLLKRKQRMMSLLIKHGFFPQDEIERKSLEKLNPYALRAKGLDHPLEPEEFARALFHINQRRGFRSNRKTDKKENDSGALKTAISALHQQLDPQGENGKARTVGELLCRRMANNEGVRARYREKRIIKDDGKTRIDKSYDLYIDRAMIESEFDQLWQKQSQLNPALFTEQARAELKDCLLFQRNLKPVIPGRCTLEPDEERAPLALPSQQRFRIYQEANHLRLIGEGLQEIKLSLEQRDALVDALEKNAKRTFIQIKKLLGLPGIATFSIEDNKRTELKGNSTSAILGKKNLFGPQWHTFSLEEQDEIVMRLLKEESEAALIAWLEETFSLDEQRAEAIANASLPEGYGSLSAKALAKILPALMSDVVTYDKAVKLAGYDHHSHISHVQSTGEFLQKLPYYGEYLQRHVGFGTGEPEDSPEKRYGKIANPTVHIGLNQIRLVVNGLIKRYGLPTEVVVEVARDLKQSQAQRKEQNRRQAENQKRNERLRKQAADMLQISESQVSRADIQKLILWEELAYDVAERRCPYSGVQISPRMALSEEVEIEHILPFSKTLDDSLNNKTLSTRKANRVKGNRTPYEARDDFAHEGWRYEDIVLRAERMPKQKRYRFAMDGYEQWLRDDKDFLARALNDTRYLSRIAREYLSLVCPMGTRVIPGQMTAKLRGKFGLNTVLDEDGNKNRHDHRHHAVDACVIGVTDQGMLQRFAEANAKARSKGLERLVETMPLPWPTYTEHVERAVKNIWISHRPDHSHEGGMHNDTAYRLAGPGRAGYHKYVEGKREYIEENLKTIGFASAKAKKLKGKYGDLRYPLESRHGRNPQGEPLPYKGYKGDSNYCLEIIQDEKGKWKGEVVSTFQAYQRVREGGVGRLRDPRQSASGQPLVMRLMINDCVRLEIEGVVRTMRVAKVNSEGVVALAEIHESNVDARNRDKADSFKYTYKTAGSLQKAHARRVTISPAGEMNDPGFRG